VVALTELIVDVLSAFRSDGPMSPGDVAQRLGIPKYKALVTVSCLAELGLLEPLYARGSYKIYKLSSLGGIVLERLKESKSMKELFQEALEDDLAKSTEGSEGAEAPRAEGSKVESQASP
jgi:DNA-binding IclR family transcriptional regulator